MSQVIDASSAPYSNEESKLDHYSHEERDPTKKKLDDANEKTTPKEEVKMVSAFKLFSKADAVEWVLLVLGVIFASGMGILLPIFLIVYGDTIDSLNSAVAVDFQEEINALAVLFVILGIAAMVSGTFQVVCFTIAGERQAQRLKELYVEAILRQDIAWFEINSPSELSSRVNMTAFEIQDGIGRKLGDLISFFVQFAASFAVAFATDWRLSGVLCLASFPVMSIAGFALTKATTSADAKGHEQYAKAGFLATEVIGGIRTVASLCGEMFEIQRYSSTLVNAEKIGIQKKVFVGLATGVTFACEIATYALGLWFGAKLAADALDNNGCANGCITGGTVVTVLFACLMGGYAVAQMTPGSTAFTTAKLAGARVFEVIERVPEIDSFSPAGEKPTLKGEIELDNLEFSYPTRPDNMVCNGYSLHIKAGETVALVGPSGSGKSTFMNMVLRFYDPQKGSVKIDGNDIKALNLQHYRSQIGYVKQEPVLFNGTISDNIKQGCPGATDEQVKAAAKQANAHAFISAFPKKYETEVGEGGSQLSGGQKQRIAIARALISKPAILLLDEATSALDNESERVVQKALDKLKRDSSHTTIIIAHRLSTIKDADRIAVIDKGRVVQCGPHAQLLRERGLYYDLWTVHGDSVEDELKEEDIETLMEREATLSRLSSVEVLEDGIQRASASDVETGTSETSKLEKVPLKRVTPYFKQDFHFVILGLIGGILGGGVMPAAGAIMAFNLEIFYYVDADEMRSEAARLALIFLALCCCTFVGFTLLYSGIGAAGEKMTKRLRNDAYKSILRQEINWFDKEENSTGNLTTHLSEDCKKVQSAFGEQWGMQVQVLSCLAVALTLGMYFSWRMGLVVLATLPCNAVAGALMMSTVQGGNYKNLSDGSDGSEAGALLSMAVNSMTTVTALNLQQELSTRYSKAAKESQKGRMKKAFIGGFAFAMATAILYFSFALMFWYAAVLIEDGTNNFKEVMAAILALIYAAFGLGQASTTAGDQKEALEATKKIFNIIDSIKDLTVDSFSSDGEKPSSCAGNICFQNVHFAYPTRPDVQIYGGSKFPEGYTLDVQAGQTVALVGPSGGGKSTAMSLLLRYYTPQHGKILLDGIDIAKLNVKWLRQQIGYVGQEPVLFSGSIRENITYGTDRVTEAQVIEASKAANAHDFIQELQGQYEAQVGEKSTLLSGGQKQRVAIARAIIRNPAILLLDEATSALDNDSEKVVQAALDKLQTISKRTTLVIAHRLSTIRNSDKIAVVKDGGIIESGTHDELICKEGVYLELNNLSGGEKKMAQQKSFENLQKLTDPLL